MADPVGADLSSARSEVSQPSEAHWDEELFATIPRRQTTDSVLECGYYSGSLRRDLENTIAAALTSRNRLGLASPPGARSGLQALRPAAAATKASVQQEANFAPEATWARGFSSSSTECWSATDQAAAARQISGGAVSAAATESGASWQAVSRLGQNRASPSMNSLPSDVVLEEERVLANHQPLGGGAEAREAPHDPQQAEGVSGLGGLTTAMVRNLPAKYTQRKFVSAINTAGLTGQYDFAYVPMDSRRHSNRGVGFVNFTTPEAADRFHHLFHDKVLPSGGAGGGSKEPRVPLAVLPADMQGFERNAVHHLSVRKEKNVDAQPLFLRPLPAHIAGAAAEEPAAPPEPPRQLPPARRRQQPRQPPPDRPAPRRQQPAPARAQAAPPADAAAAAWAWDAPPRGGAPPTSAADHTPAWTAHSKQQQQQQQRPSPKPRAAPKALGGAPAPAPGAEEAPRRAKFCSECGRKRLEEHVFCPYCGTGF